ncbi:Na+/H+ antiporter subunit E [Alkaliphilus serpentinus]|nr:Na+/H+ antiporter subunit E [Alkaliphilus serpentinus]
MKLIRQILKKQNLFLFILLFLFWMVLTPSYKPQSMIAGFVVCGGVVIFCRDLFFNDEETSLYTLKGILNFFVFVRILLVEIIKANIDVARVVLSPSLPITPGFVKVRNYLKKDMNKVIYANAITLTPGTLTVDVNEEGYVIHALTKEAGEGVENSNLEKYAMKLEEGEK